eukprot:6327514-Amphidinium_carterae.1
MSNACIGMMLIPVNEGQQHCTHSLKQQIQECSDPAMRAATVLRPAQLRVLCAGPDSHCGRLCPLRL